MIDRGWRYEPGVIPSGTLDHDRLARARASAQHPARTADVAASQRTAQAAIDKLLTTWHAGPSRALESAPLWEDAALEAIDALSALLGEVDLAHAGPVLISQRSRT
jgi:hypothetical protein